MSDLVVVGTRVGICRLNILFSLRQCKCGVSLGLAGKGRP